MKSSCFVKTKTFLIGRKIAPGGRNFIFGESVGGWYFRDNMLVANRDCIFFQVREPLPGGQSLETATCSIKMF